MKPIKRCCALVMCSLLLNAPAVAQTTCSACGTSSCQENLCDLCGQKACHTLCDSIFWTAKPMLTPCPEATKVPAFTKTPAPAPAVSPEPEADATKIPSQSMGDYTTESLSMQEQKAWNLLNQDRERNGLAPLPMDSALSAIARIKSEEMAALGYFSHTSPNYGSASDMLRHFGYAFSAVSENIAHHATVEKSQAAFMSSDGHRRNILGKNWQKVGVGVYTDANGFVYVTQLFAR